MVELGNSVYLDGQWVPGDSIKLGLTTHSLHYGCAVFDGLRVYQNATGSAVFRLREHAQRFVDSCRIVRMDLSVNVDELCDVIVETVRRNNHKACYIRPLAYYGDDRMGLSTVGLKSHIAVMTWKWGAYLGDDGLLNGIRVKTSTYGRHHPNITMVRAKVSGNYVNSQMAKFEAINAGYDEALMLDPEGFVVEGSGENLFIVEQGRLITPPQGSILPGITRDTIMTLALDLDVDVSEERITRDRAALADEMFLTGTAAEVTPVREYDGLKIGAGKPGPITKELQAKYFQAVGGELTGYESWLTSVPF